MAYLSNKQRPKVPILVRIDGVMKSWVCVTLAEERGSRKSYGVIVRYARFDVPPVLPDVPGFVTVIGTVPGEPIK